MRRRVFCQTRVKLRSSEENHSETYGSLLNDDALDVQILEVNVLRVRVRLGVLEEASDELDGLLGPATFIGLKTTRDNRQTCQTPKKNHF